MLNKIKHILVLAEDGGLARQRIKALIGMGYEVDFVRESAENHCPGISYYPTFFERVWNKLGFPRDIYHVNQKVLLELKKKKYDLFWVEKSMTLRAKTIRRIKTLYPGVKITWYSPDDMFVRHNQSHFFLKSLPFYDIVFTTKTFNCQSNELPALGAKKVIFVENAFDKKWHSPVELAEGDRSVFGSDVGFIGTFEKDRAEKLLFLAKNAIQVRVWGNGWGRYVGKHPNLIVENKPVYDLNYQKVICSTKINLCFLRKINRDLQTSRSVEIPAMGGFMLAERTQEHLGLFSEDKEAVYFDVNDSEELLTKVQYYLKHDERRNRIAAAGRERCLSSDYSHEARWRFMLSQIEEEMG